MEKRVNLTLPAQKQMLLVIRMTTSGVLARANLSVDSLEDMLQAVEEAFGFLAEKSGCRQVSLEYDFLEKAVVVRIAAVACPRACSKNALPEAVIHDVLEAFADEVVMEGKSITLTKYHE